MKTNGVADLRIKELNQMTCFFGNSKNFILPHCASISPQDDMSNSAQNMPQVGMLLIEIYEAPTRANLSRTIAELS